MRSLFSRQTIALESEKSRQMDGFLIRLGICIKIFLAFAILPTSGTVSHLDGATFESTIGSAEVALVNFYADWCRYSQLLTPIFEEASNKFNDKQNVIFASVDCDRHVDVAQKYHINKYPTLKLFRKGELSKREYRGQRSVEAISAFVQQQLDQTFKEFTSADELDTNLNKAKRSIIAYFAWKTGPEWDNFQKISSNLREDCDFWFGVGDNFKDKTVNGNILLFREPHSNEEQTFSGGLQDYDYLKQWITDKCIPLVREITFENAEELTEEGLPFLILFRHPTDQQILETYTQEVARQLIDQKNAINFLVADGQKFAHPLHHLGKTERDLPVLTIDSFRHMYLFPDIKDLTVNGKLRQFVLDLHSGKLHREFHHGPDPPAETDTADPNADPSATNNVPDGSQGGSGGTSPPESVFQKLKPSRSRYSIADMKDEL